MAQGSRATEGTAPAYTGTLLTGDGVSELCDHLLTDRCLKDRGEEEGKREDRREGGRPKGGRQQNKTSGKAVHKQESGKKTKNLNKKRQQRRTVKEKHRDAWKMAERGGHRMVGKEKEKEMGEDEETDRHGRYPRSRESYYNPNTQNTKCCLVQYGTMHR